MNSESGSIDEFIDLKILKPWNDFLVANISSCIVIRREGGVVMEYLFPTKFEFKMKHDVLRSGVHVSYFISEKQLPSEFGVWLHHRIIHSLKDLSLEKKFLESIRDYPEEKLERVAQDLTSSLS